MQVSIKKIGDVALIAPQIPQLDATNAAAFKEFLAPLQDAHTRLVLDLSALRFIDSSGLAAILSCLKRLNRRGGDLKLCGLSRSVYTLFELARMHRLFDFFATPEEAVRSALWECPWKLLHIVLQPEDRIRRISDQIPSLADPA